MLLVALGLALLAAWREPATLAWLLARIPGLQVQGVAGSLAERQLRIERLSWALPGDAGVLELQGLALDGVSVQARPHDGAWAGLRLQRLAIGVLAWRPGAPSTRPAVPPQALRSPVALQIAALSIGRLDIQQAPPMHGLQAALEIAADGGQRHRLAVSQLGLAPDRLADGRIATDEWAAAAAPGTGAAAPPDWQGTIALDGQFTLGADAPLPLQARLSARGGSARPWQAQATLDGPITALATRLALQIEPDAAASGRRPGLEAAATVSPWQPWPLPRLQLRTEALDLHSLNPAWPRTALDGQAGIELTGLDQPARLQARLRNAEPARFDRGGLPIAQLDLQAGGRPSQPGDWRLPALSLVLADGSAAAGTVTGTGGWQGEALALDLRVSGLKPALLHAQATPMQLDGPTRLQLSGPALHALAAGPAPPPAAARPGRPAGASGPGAGWQLGFDIDLAGALADPAVPPAAVKARGTAWAEGLQLDEAQLRSAGASARGQARLGWAAPRWQAEGQLAWRDFDPRRWWQGRPGSALQRGEHRLQGELQGRAAADGALADWLNLLARQPAQALDRLSAEARLALAPSLLSGVPVEGTAELSGSGAQLALRADLQAAGNQLGVRMPIRAWFDPASAPAPLQAEWTMNRLAALAAWKPGLAERWPQAAAHWPRAGSTSGRLSWWGRLDPPVGQGELSLQGWQSDALQLDSATASWRFGSGGLGGSGGAGGSAGAAGSGGPGAAAGSGGASGSAGSAPPGRAAAAGAGPLASFGGSLDPLALDLEVQGLQQGDRRIDRATARVQGTVALHQIRLSVEAPVRPPEWTEAWIGASGNGSSASFQGEGRWQPVTAAGGQPAGRRWTLSQGELSASPRGTAAAAPRWIQAASLAALLEWSASGQLQRIALSPGQARLAEAAGLSWQRLEWQADPALPAGRWWVEAQVERFALAGVLQRLQPTVGWGGDLAVEGRIQLQGSERLQAELALERTGGDLTLTDELQQVQSLGMTDLRLVLSARDGVWQLAQGLAGRTLGSLVGAQVIETPPGQAFPSLQDPLRGVVQARVGQMAAWGVWLPPGWRLSGSLVGDFALGGRVGAPEMTGQLQGRDLALRSVLEGVSLTEGSFDLELGGETLELKQARFRAGEGTLAMQGSARTGERAQAALQLVAERAQLLGRIDRRIIASGRAELKLDRDRLALQGRLRADEGLIDFSRSSAPTLDSDVVVHRAPPAAGAAPTAGGPAARASTAAPAPARPMPKALQAADVRLLLELGDRLVLSGRGIDTRLGGELVFTAPGLKPQLNGTVRALDGRYLAYGQKLEIERGEVVFSGPLDNPRLDILAVRPNLDVVAGVTIRGFVQNPRIRLYSEPEVSDYEKLSWLVLGRGPDGLGSADTALLQGAAMALLAGEGGGPTDQLLKALGIDDFSVRQASGDTRDTIISLGRQLSRRWYVGYERSVNATTGTWQLVYRIAQRFTLRAQAGSSDNAVDLIWTWRW